MKEQGLMAGKKSDGKFYPDEPLTRAQAASVPKSVSKTLQA